MTLTSETSHTHRGAVAAQAAGGADAWELAPVDLHAEGQRVWAAFQELTAGMAGFDSLKRCPEFAYLDGVKDGVNLYTYFPFLFVETFPTLGVDVFRKLSLMSLLYVHHIIIADALLDDDKELPRESLLVSNACSLRALEILTGLFGRKPFPWREVTELHRQYSLATALEKERPAGGELPGYTFDDLMSRLSRKSAMAKLIPLALCALSGRRGLLGPLNASFELYYLSEQLVDDFRDWKDDLAAGRYSYLLTSVFNACNLSRGAGGADEQTVGKYMYLSGVAESYLARAVDYCEQAKEAAARLRCPRWIRFLDSFQMGIHVSQSNISRRSRQLLLQPDRYEYGLAPPGLAAGARGRAGVPHPVLSVAPTVSQAGRRAADFFSERYKPGTGFEDFMMAPGQLPVWVGGYVGVSLLEWMESAGVRRAGGRPLLRTLGRLADLLRKKQGPGGCWAPTPSMPEDADTSAWVIDFLLGLGRAEGPLLRKALDGLLAYRRDDGSFGTYIPGALGPGADGYYDGHVEVTAVVANLLMKAGLAPSDEIVVTAMDYIRRRQGTNLLWQAYWWDGQMYATYHCLKTLKAGGVSIEGRARDRIADAVLSVRSADGSWGEATFGKNRPFETAWAVKTLLLLDPSAHEGEAVRRGVTWLMNYQAADGGFYSWPMLRLPPRGETEPWRRTQWTQDTVYGFGILGRDEKRFFTTATALSALAGFMSLAGDQRAVTYLKPAPAQRAAAGQNATAAAQRPPAHVGGEL